MTITLTSIDLSLESAPQVKIPEGPDPITKTFLPIFSDFSLLRIVLVRSCIQKYFWSDGSFLKLSNLTGPDFLEFSSFKKMKNFSSVLFLYEVLRDTILIL